MSVELANRLGDLEWLLEVGEWPPRAAERCGWTLSGAEQAARRYGATSLARTLNRHISVKRSAA